MCVVKLSGVMATITGGQAYPALRWGASRWRAPTRKAGEEEQRDGAAEQSGEGGFTHGMRRFWARSSIRLPPACHRAWIRRCVG